MKLFNLKYGCRNKHFHHQLPIFKHFVVIKIPVLLTKLRATGSFFAGITALGTFFIGNLMIGILKVKKVKIDTLDIKNLNVQKMNVESR
ncbi:MAG: hypothetical protein GXY77_11665 [Fibrobacter sp.]|nr:hypothetical protein [Fibrobacter sp.]